MFSRFTVLFVTLTVYPAVSLCQTLTSTPSNIVDVRRGVSYRVDPNPASQYPITPADSGKAGGPMVFEIVADSGSRWTIQFTIPTALTGSIPLSFEDSSGYHVQEGRYFNATRSNTFTADSRGKITIGIGPTVTVPASALSGDEYAGAILCTTTRVGGNDTTLSTVTAISFTIGCQELSAQNINGHVDGLAIGHVYTLDPMSELIFPIINGSERGSPIGFNIIADPGQEILLHLTLPQHLIREHGDSLPCAFSKSSLVRLEDSLLVDPDLPHVFNSGTGGSVKLRLGMSITVPKNARGGTYSDSVLWMVLYTGSPAKSAGLRNSCSTESAGYTVYTVRIVTPLPEEYALYQNYPNPFNSTTTIRYNLPDPSMISLKVYDLLGREVATLVSGFQQAGELRTIWDAHEASSGVYLYRFRTASFSDTRKLIISR